MHSNARFEVECLDAQIASSAAGLKLPKDANPPMMLLRLRCTEAGMITRTHNDSL